MTQVFLGDTPQDWSTLLLFLLPSVTFHLASIIQSIKEIFLNKRQTDVNFTNILQAAFMFEDP